MLCLCLSFNLSKNQRFGVALIFCNVNADAGFEFDGELTHLYIRSYTEGGRKEAATVFSKVETKELSLWESQMKYCGISIDFIFKNGMLNCVPTAWTFRLSKLLPPLISIPFICAWQPGLTGYHSYGMQLLNFYFCCVCFALSCLSSAFSSFSISLRLTPVLLNPVQYLLCGSNRLVEGI